MIWPVNAVGHQEEGFAYEKSGRPEDRPDTCLVNHVDGFPGYGVEA
jgi:hypothetical protein